MQLRWIAPCSALQRHGKWCRYPLPSFPPTTPIKYVSGYSKKSYHDGEVTSLWGTSPLAAKNLADTVPKTKTLQRKLISALPSTLVTSCVRLATHLFVQPSAFAACAMLQPGWLRTSLCTKLSSAELPPVQSLPTLHLYTWLLLSKPNILHLSWLNHIQGYLTLFCQLVTSFKHSHHHEIHFMFI